MPGVQLNWKLAEWCQSIRCCLPSYDFERAHEQLKDKKTGDVQMSERCQSTKRWRYRSRQIVAAQDPDGTSQEERDEIEANTQIRE